MTKKESLHAKKVEAFKNFWEFFGAWTSQHERCNNAKQFYFKNDFIADLSGQWDLMEQLDCSYVWVEVVKERPINPEKKEWLPKMLSKKWLILECGYAKTFRVERPIAYKESEGKKMTSEETEEVLNKLLQQKIMLQQKLAKNTRETK